MIGAEARYYGHDDGRVLVLEVVDLSGPDGFSATLDPPEGFVLISRAEGEQRMAAHQHQRELSERRAGIEQDRQRGDDHAALLQIGVPDDLARRLTGYRGPPPDGSTEQPGPAAGG